GLIDLHRARHRGKLNQTWLSPSRRGLNSEAAGSIVRSWLLHEHDNRAFSEWCVTPSEPQQCVPITIGALSPTGTRSGPSSGRDQRVSQTAWGADFLRPDFWPARQTAPLLSALRHPELGFRGELKCLRHYPHKGALPLLDRQSFADERRVRGEIS